MSGFSFDANGDKNPNIMCRDQLRFLLCPTDSDYWKNSGTFMPYQKTSDTTRAQLYNNCVNDALYCSALLMLDGWEYKDDYPYRL